AVRAAAGEDEQGDDERTHQPRAYRKRRRRARITPRPRPTNGAASPAAPVAPHPQRAGAGALGASLVGAGTSGDAGLSRLPSQSQPAACVKPHVSRIDPSTRLAVSFTASSLTSNAM